jgi:hypothetical protein
VDQQRLEQMATYMLDAWNTQDVDRVLACYTNELRYCDPNTTGDVVGAAAMRAYLNKLFARWTMHWSLREAFALGVEGGAAVLWRATFRRKGGTQTALAQGMDLVLLEGDRIARNDVYFDRSVLMPLAMEASQTP